MSKVPSSKGRANGTQAVAKTSRSAVDLGPGALLVNEDRASYDQLLASVSDHLAPRDVIEEMLVRDVVDLSWEARRLRILKASLLNASEVKGLRLILEPAVGDTRIGPLLYKWYGGDAEARKEVEALLKQIGHSRDAVMAQTLAAKLAEVETIDRLTANAEGRRSAALRELDRHRDAMAERRRHPAADVEDAEFTEVPRDRAALGPRPS
jgi:hypothetical protein